MRPAFGEFDAFEHADFEVFAFGFPAEDVPGEGAKGGCCFDDWGGVGEGGGAAGVGEYSGGGGVGVGVVVGGGGGSEEREVEHEISDGEVGGRAGEVQGQGYVVGLEGGEGCGERGCAVRVAIAVVFAWSFSMGISRSTFSPKENPCMEVGRESPKLQMHDPLHAILRHVIIIEKRVRYA